jgi:hypothetical protein
MRKAFGLCFDLPPGYLDTASIGVRPQWWLMRSARRCIRGVAVVMPRRTSMRLSL